MQALFLSAMHVSDLRSLTTRASALYLQIKKHPSTSKLVRVHFYFQLHRLLCSRLFPLVDLGLLCTIYSNWYYHLHTIFSTIICIIFFYGVVCGHGEVGGNLHFIPSPMFLCFFIFSLFICRTSVFCLGNNIRNHSNSQSLKF